MAIKLIDLFGNINIEGLSARNGINYMRSKRGIAIEVMQAIYDTVGNFDTFYDLFGGGGAMTFLALEIGIENIHYNELNSGVSNLMKFLRDNNIPADWYKFVDREMFFEFKDNPEW